VRSGGAVLTSGGAVEVSGAVGPRSAVGLCGAVEGAAPEALLAAPVEAPSSAAVASCALLSASFSLIISTAIKSSFDNWRAFDLRRERRFCAVLSSFWRVALCFFNVSCSFLSWPMWAPQSWVAGSDCKIFLNLDRWSSADEDSEMRSALPAGVASALVPSTAADVTSTIGMYPRVSCQGEARLADNSQRDGCGPAGRDIDHCAIPYCCLVQSELCWVLLIWERHLVCPLEE
jgi:hypothetical protein